MSRPQPPRIVGDSLRVRGSRGTVTGLRKSSPLCLSTLYDRGICGRPTRDLGWLTLWVLLPGTVGTTTDTTNEDRGPNDTGVVEGGTDRAESRRTVSTTCGGLRHRVVQRGSRSCGNDGRRSDPRGLRLGLRL